MSYQEEKKALGIGELLARKLIGQLTDEEGEKLAQWLSESGDHQKVYEEIEQDASRKEAVKEFSYFDARIALPKVLGRLPSANPATKYAYGKVAAVILLLLTGLVYWYVDLIKEYLYPAREIRFSTANGEIKQFTLPDHSKVWLNAGSSLSFIVDRQQRERVARLEGEAFFDVATDVKHPFRVELPNSIRIEVMGTSFNAKSYQGEEQARVSLLGGKVQVKDESLADQGGMLLLPGEEAIWNGAARQLIKKNINETDIAAWRNRAFYFDEEPFRTVIATLERRFKVHIQVETPSLLDKKTSIRFGNEPLQELLIPLSYSHHFNYSFINDSTVVIK